jgi:hypothetical protein
MIFFKSDKHLAWHTVLVEAIVICLSVLPAGLFTWYAQNRNPAGRKKISFAWLTQ